MRITKENLTKTFEHFLKAFRKRHRKAWNDVGGWFIDPAPMGGYRIASVANASGAVSHPLGETVYTASELYHAMWLAIRAKQS